jgi:hypothetical protein
MKLSTFAPSVVTASAPRATATPPTPASQARSGYIYNNNNNQRIKISISELTRLLLPQLNSPHFTFSKEDLNTIMVRLSASNMIDFIYSERGWLFQLRKPHQRQITSIHITPPSLSPSKGEFGKLTELFEEIHRTVFPKVEQYRNARGSLRKKRSRNR